MKMKDKNFVYFMYTTVPGRFILNLMNKTHILRIGERFMNSGLSKPMIKRFIRKNRIDMSEFNGQSYRNFQEFFARTKKVSVDMNSAHLISPCDGLVSVFPINSNSIFSVKGSDYRIKDLVEDEKLAEKFYGGTCLILRLCADDYHHYCFIDNGYQHKSHYIEGMLHSVQPIACEKEPVYRLNRRVWTVLDTENFGQVIHIFVGAVLVGGIVNICSEENVKRGEEMGHFELAGSTIVMLFEKDKIKLTDNISENTKNGDEFRVRIGEHIGYKFI